MEQPGKKLNREKVQKILKAIILVTALFALVVIGLAALSVGRSVRFYLVEGTEIRAPYGEPFEDPGCRAVRVGLLPGDGEVELPVETVGEVDTNTLGSYDLQYRTRCFLYSYSTGRTVHVVDMTPPVITLEHTEGYAPNWLNGYQEEGYSALDNCDGDLTQAVQRRMFADRVEYTVSDAVGNETTAVRNLDYIVQRPEIRLEGEPVLEINAQLDFEDPGFTAFDSLGNDLREYVQIEGEFVSYQPGSYERRYYITNAMGDTVSATRTVNVHPAALPETVRPDGKVIYLTFDDGPGPYTARLLDILDKYGAKATFFVTCLNPDYEYLVGRAYREGHSIGVHTATHNYYTIYGSEEAFLEDFRETEEMIYRQTGSYTRLFRFPGGSSNTVSNFNPGIMSRLTKIMSDMGYSYYDWDVTSGDAGGTDKTSIVLDNIIEGCSGLRVSVVLQHDTKDFSVAAVDKLLSWGFRNGYSFLPLNESSPKAQHHVSN